MNPRIIYCYDAYCGWCYGFSSVINLVEKEYKNKFEFEVLSGGMIVPEKPIHIAATANYILEAYRTVEEYSGAKFGDDYLWHIKNPNLSDWFPNSLKPAIALCIFKEIYPEKQIAFATDLQYALYFEGRDLTDNEAYRHLLEQYNISAEIFYEKMQSDAYKAKATYEFALCKQLHITGFPTAFIQYSDTKFYMIAKGYTSFENIKTRIDNILNEHS